MQHRKEADFSSQEFRVGRNSAKGFGSCPEQDGINDPFVLKSDGGNFIRNGEDDVEIGNRKQLGHARL